MPPSSVPAPPPRPARSLLARCLALLVLVFFGAAVCLKLYLASPLASGQLSSFLSGYLHYPVSVSALETRGGVLVVRGISIANPEGFPSGELATVGTLTIVPRWMELLRGGRDFRRIELDRVRIALGRNGEGAWNWAGLRQRFAAGKKPAPETRVGELVIRDGALLVDGRGVTGISLRIRDLATRGAADSRLELAFADGAGNRYRVEGSAHPGPEPSFDLNLAAPSLSLAPLADTIKRRDLSLEKAAGSLALAARLHGGRLRAEGAFAFRGVAVKVRGATLPLGGKVALRASYEPERDTARLEGLDVVLDDLLTARLSGTVNRARSDRVFAAELSLDDVDLARLSPLLSAATGRTLSLAGRIGSRGVRVAGDGARGVTGVEGGLALRDGALSLDGRTLARGVAGTALCSAAPNGYRVRGRLASSGGEEGALLERLDLPFTLLLSGRFRPIGGDVPSLEARVAGVPVTGRLGFRPAAENPLVASLRVPLTPLAPFAPKAERFGFRPATGDFSLSLDIEGRGAADFAGEAIVRTSSLAGEVKGKRIALREGELRFRFGRDGKRLEAAGSVRLDGGAFDGKNGELRSAFRLADRTLTLADLRGRLAAVAVTAERVAVQLPAGSRPGGGPLPLSVELAGGAVSHGDAAAEGLGASFRGSYHAAPPERRLEGEGVASAGRLSFRGKPAGAPSVRFTLARGEATAELGGRLLDGNLSGRVSFDPRVPAAGASFKVGLREGRLAALAGLLPATLPAAPADGVVTATADGTFARKGGLSARVEARADGIALEGKGGKRLLSGAGLRLAGQVAGEKVVVREAVARVGEGAALRLQGEMERAFGPAREGRFAFALPRTPVEALVDPVVNALPRFLQEATVAGSLAAEGTAAVRGKAVAVDGSITLDGVRLDVPSHRLAVTGVGGTVPISLDTSPGAPRRSRDGLYFTKTNYPRLLERLGRVPTGGQALTIGAIRFGPLEVGETVLRMKGGGGAVEISSIRSGLYGGKVLGRGFVSLKRGLSYEGDILVHDLSLGSLCDAIPRVKGYVRGRLDGVVSIEGEGKGLSGLNGFTDLWAREGSGERMLLSKEFLQRLAGRKLRGFFFREDRPFDRGEMSAYLEEGYLTFTTLDISHTNLFGVRDLNVSVAPIQNRISLEHLAGAIKEAAARGKVVKGGEAPAGEPPLQTEFQWSE